MFISNNGLSLLSDSTNLDELNAFQLIQCAKFNYANGHHPDTSYRCEFNESSMPECPRVEQCGMNLVFSDHFLNPSLMYTNSVTNGESCGYSYAQNKNNLNNISSMNGSLETISPMSLTSIKQCHSIPKYGTPQHGYINFKLPEENTYPTLANTCFSNDFTNGSNDISDNPNQLRETQSVCSLASTGSPPSTLENSQQVLPYIYQHDSNSVLPSHKSCMPTGYSRQVEQKYVTAPSSSPISPLAYSSNDSSCPSEHSSEETLYHTSKDFSNRSEEDKSIPPKVLTSLSSDPSSKHHWTSNGLKKELFHEKQTNVIECKAVPSTITQYNVNRSRCYGTSLKCKQNDKKKRSFKKTSKGHCKDIFLFTPSRRKSRAGRKPLSGVFGVCRQDSRWVVSYRDEKEVSRHRYFSFQNEEEQEKQLCFAKRFLWKVVRLGRQLNPRDGEGLEEFVRNYDSDGGSEFLGVERYVPVKSVHHEMNQSDRCPILPNSLPMCYTSASSPPTPHMSTTTLGFSNNTSLYEKQKHSWNRPLEANEANHTTPSTEEHVSHYAKEAHLKNSDDSSQQCTSTMETTTGGNDSNYLYSFDISPPPLKTTSIQRPSVKRVCQTPIKKNERHSSFPSARYHSKNIFYTNKEENTAATAAHLRLIQSTPLLQTSSSNTSQTTTPFNPASVNKPHYTHLAQPSLVFPSTMNPCSKKKKKDFLIPTQNTLSCKNYPTTTFFSGSNIHSSLELERISKDIGFHKTDDEKTLLKQSNHRPNHSQPLETSILEKKHPYLTTSRMLYPYPIKTRDSLYTMLPCNPPSPYPCSSKSLIPAYYTTSQYYPPFQTPKESQNCQSFQTPKESQNCESFQTPEESQNCQPVQTLEESHKCESSKTPEESQNCEPSNFPTCTLLSDMCYQTPIDTLNKTNLNNKCTSEINGTFLNKACTNNSNEMSVPENSPRAYGPTLYSNTLNETYRSFESNFNHFIQNFKTFVQFEDQIRLERMCCRYRKATLTYFSPNKGFQSLHVDRFTRTTPYSHRPKISFGSYTLPQTPMAPILT